VSERVGSGQTDGVAAGIAASGHVDKLLDQPQAKGRLRDRVVGVVRQGFVWEKADAGINRAGSRICHGDRNPARLRPQAQHGWGPARA